MRGRGEATVPKPRKLAETVIVAILLILLSAVALMRILGGCSRFFGF